MFCWPISPILTTWYLSKLIFTCTNILTSTYTYEKNTLWDTINMQIVGSKKSIHPSFTIFF